MSADQSYGCEFQPFLTAEMDSMRASGLLQHVQVTIPGMIPFASVFEARQQAAVIAHSNLLNTFGENNWDELAIVSRQIRALNPVHVVEHFTAFRPNAKMKTGVYFDTALLRLPEKIKIVDTIRKWQDLAQAPICIENIPLAAEVDAYFDLMMEVRDLTGCGIACDVPHFILSMISAGKSEETIVSLARCLDPVQLHVGGLSVMNGIVRDNHKTLSPWIVGYSKKLFPLAKFITIEQSPQIPLSSIRENLKLIQGDDLDCEIPDIFSGVRGFTASECNEELSLDTAKGSNFPGPVWILQEQGKVDSCGDSSFDLLTRYLPFLFPLESITGAIDHMEPFQTVKSCASLVRCALSYLSWWYPELSGTGLISYGEGERTLLSATLVGWYANAQPSKIETKIDTKAIRFESRNGFWVEVAAPRIPSVTVRDSHERSYL